VATPALIVVLSVALLTLVALGLTVLSLLRHLKGLTATLSRMRDELQPSLSALAADAEVTRAELERVSETAAGSMGDGRSDGRHSTR
jgi:hypothetical protein